MCKDVSSYNFVIFFITLTVDIFLFKYRVAHKAIAVECCAHVHCKLYDYLLFFFFFFPVSKGGRNDDSNKTSAPTTVFL